MSNDVPYLHLYAQDYSHVEAYVMGNREALEGLRDAINRALHSGEPDKAVTYAADGEGYNTLVLLVDSETFRESELPYTDSPCSKSGVHPYALLSKSEYIRLMRP